VLRTDDRRNFPDGGQAGHEDAVAADAGALLLAEVDQPAQPVEPDYLLCQGRIIAQSEIGKKKFYLKLDQSTVLTFLRS
jgi:hypothetical protein